jgi:hypothetical protein
MIKSRFFSLATATAAAAATAAALCATLAACGGGGGGSGFTPTAAAGLYESTGGATPAFEVLMLDSGRLYAIYGLNPTTPVPAGGVIVGDTATSANTFTSSAVHDFNLVAHTVATGTATGTFIAKTSISGTAITSAATSAFGGAYSTSYDQSASLSSLVGTYGGQISDLGGNKVSVVTVDASGVLVGTTTSGCGYLGLAKTHSAGNVFDVSVTYQTGCTENGNTFKGHAFVSHNVLYFVTLNGDQSRAVLFAGVKS